MKSYLETQKKEDCFGCRACELICPKKCITMKENEEGFLYPSIDKSKCISCNRCIKVCPHTDSKNSSFACEIYAVQTKNKEILMQSSSGGAFSELANYILDANGVVFGTTMENDKVKCIGITKKEDLNKLRGSKYVQSDTKNTYKEVKQLADKNKLILYTGTPCQIAGLKKYLGKEYSNILTVDIICHGVPSQKFLRKYLNYIKNKYGYKKVELNFRDKSINKWSLTLKCTLTKKSNVKTKYFTPQTSSYYYAFINGLNYRESCYKCSFAKESREGDITIGDFWNLEDKKKSLFNWKNGISLMMINSKEGKKVFEAIKNKIYYCSSNMEEAKSGNIQLSRPTERKKVRNIIYELLENMDYSEFEKKYLRSKEYPKYKIRSLIGIQLKKIENKMINKE